MAARERVGDARVGLTGFDPPSCSTVCLDKPIRNHTLMQTIARANRVFEEARFVAVSMVNGQRLAADARRQIPQFQPDCVA